MTDINQNSMDSRRTEFRVGSEVTDPTYGVGRVIRLTTAGAIVSSVVVLFYKIAKEYEFTREGVFNLNELRVVGSIDTLAQVGNTVVNTVKEIAEGLTKPGTAVAKETLTWRQLASQLQGMKFRENGQLYNIVQKRLMSVVARYENTKVLPRLETITDPDLLMEVLNPLFPEDWAKDILLKALSGKKKLPVGIQIVDKPGTSQINKQLYAKSETKRVSLGHRLDESIKLKEYAGVKAGVGQPAEVASAFSPPRIGKPTVIEPPQPITNVQKPAKNIYETINRLRASTNPFDKTKVDGKIYEAMDAKVIRRKEAADLLQELVSTDPSTAEKTIENVLGRMFGGDKHYQKLAGNYDDLLTFDHTGTYIGQKYDVETPEIIRRMTTYAGKRVDVKNALELKKANGILSAREATELARITTVGNVLSNNYITAKLRNPDADILTLLHQVVPLEANHSIGQASLTELAMFIPQAEQLGWAETMDKFKTTVKRKGIDKNLLKIEIFEDLKREAERVLLQVNPFLLTEHNRDLFMDSAVNWRMRDVYKEGPDDANSLIKMFEKNRKDTDTVGKVYSSAEEIGNAINSYKAYNQYGRNNTIMWHMNQVLEAEKQHALLTDPAQIVKNRIFEIHLQITKGSGVFGSSHDNIMPSFEELSHLGVENQRLLEMLQNPNELQNLSLTAAENKAIADSSRHLIKTRNSFADILRLSPNTSDSSILSALPELSVATNVKDRYNKQIDTLNSYINELRIIIEHQTANEKLSVHEQEVLDSHNKNGTTIELAEEHIIKIRQKINLLGDLSTYAMQSYTGESRDLKGTGDILSDPLQKHSEENEQTVGGKKTIKTLENADLNDLLYKDSSNANEELEAKIENQIRQRVGDLSSAERTLAMAEKSDELSIGKIQITPGYDANTHFLALASEGKLDNEEKLLDQFDKLKAHHENFMEENSNARDRYLQKGNEELQKTGQLPQWFDPQRESERFDKLEQEVLKRQRMFAEIEQNVNLQKSGKDPEWWKTLQKQLSGSSNDSFWDLAIDKNDFFQKVKTTRSSVTAAGIGQENSKLTSNENLITVNVPKITDLDAPEMSVITDLIQKLNDKQNTRVIDLDKKYRFGNNNPYVSIDDIIKHAGIEINDNPKNMTFTTASTIKDLALRYDKSINDDFTTTQRNGFLFEIQSQINVEAKTFLDRQIQKALKDGTDIAKPEAEFTKLLRTHLNETSTQLSILRNISPSTASQVSVGLGLSTEDLTETALDFEQEQLENIPKLHTDYNQSTITKLINQHQRKADELQYSIEELQAEEKKLLPLDRQVSPLNQEFANMTDDDLDKKIADILIKQNPKSPKYPKSPKTRLKHTELLSKYREEVAARKNNKAIRVANRTLQREVTSDSKSLKKLEEIVDKKQGLIEELELTNKRIAWAKDVRNGNVSQQDVEWLLEQYHTQMGPLGLTGKVAHPLVNHPEIIKQMHDLGIGDMIKSVTYDNQTIKTVGTIQIGDNLYFNGRVPSNSGTGTYFDQSARLNTEGATTIKQSDYNKVMNESTKILTKELTKEVIQTNKRLVENNGISTFIDAATNKVTGEESLERLLTARKNGSTTFLMDTEFFRNNIYQVGHGEYNFGTNQLNTASTFIEVDKTVASKMREYLLYQDKTISEKDLKFLRIGIKNTLKTLQEATQNMAFGTNAYREADIDNALNFMTNQHEKLTNIAPEKQAVIERIRPIKLTTFVENTLLGNNSDYIMNQNLLGADLGTIVRQLQNIRSRSIAEYDSIGELITRVQGLTGKSIDTMMAMYASRGIHAGLGNYTNIGHEGEADIIAVVRKQLDQISGASANNIKEGQFYVNKTTGHIYTPEGNMRTVKYSGRDGAIEERSEQTFKRITDELKHEKFRTLETITLTGPTESNLAANAINTKFFKFDDLAEAKTAREQLIADKAIRRITPNPSRKVASGSEDMYYVKSDIRAAEMLNSGTDSSKIIEETEKRINLFDSRGLPTEEERQLAIQQISELNANREALIKLEAHLTPAQLSAISVQESTIAALRKAKHTFADVEIAEAQARIERIKRDPKYKTEEHTKLIDNLKKYIQHTEKDEEYLSAIADPANPITSKTALEIEKRALRKFKNATDVERVIRVNSNVQGQLLLNSAEIYNRPNSAYLGKDGIVSMIDHLLEKVNSDTLTIIEANNIYKSYMVDLVNSGVIAAQEISRKSVVGDVTKRFADHTLEIFGKETKLNRLDVSSPENFHNSLTASIFRANDQIKKDIVDTTTEVMSNITKKFSTVEGFRQSLLDETINVTNHASFNITSKEKDIKLEKITNSYKTTIDSGPDSIQVLLNHRDTETTEVVQPQLKERTLPTTNSIQHELLSTNESIVNISKPQIESALNTGGMETAIRGMAESTVGMHNKFGAAGIAISALLIGGMMLVRPNLNTNEKKQEPDNDFSIKDMLKNITKTYKAIDKFTKNLDDKILGKERKQQNEENEHNIPMHRVLEAPINAYKSVDNFAERMDIRIRGTVKKESGPDIIAQITHNVLNTVTKKTLGVDLDEKRESKNPDKYWARGLQNKL